MTRASSTAEIRAAKPLSLQQLLERAIVVFLVWYFVYLFVQGDDGVFARTVELVEDPLLAGVFLNIVLQLFLTLAIVACLVSRREGWQRLGLGLACLNAVLILGHWVLSFVHA